MPAASPHVTESGDRNGAQHRQRRFARGFLSRRGGVIAIDDGIEEHAVDEAR